MAELSLHVELAEGDFADLAEGMGAVLDAADDLDLAPALVRVLLALDEAITAAYPPPAAE